MNEARLLRRLKRGDVNALELLIDRYSAYVFTIAANILSPALSREDIEETASDVFLSLWNHRDAVEEGKLKAYLAAIARNAARNRLRALRLAEPLDEDALEIADPGDGPEEETLQRELRALAREAVDALPEPDREIFQRYYYLYERTADIALDMGLNLSTVTTKLARGRQKLRAYFSERGYASESTIH